MDDEVSGDDDGVDDEAIFRQEILQYLSLDNIVNLDNACMSHEYRPQLLGKIYGAILLGDKDEYMKALLFKWLGMRRIYLISMNLHFEDDNSFPSSMENDYRDQFSYTHHRLYGDIHHISLFMYAI